MISCIIIFNYNSYNTTSQLFKRKFENVTQHGTAVNGFLTMSVMVLGHPGHLNLGEFSIEQLDFLSCWKTFHLSSEGFFSSEGQRGESRYLIQSGWRWGADLLARHHVSC